MKDLLVLAKGMWDFIYLLFIVGLYDFNNPILSFMDYAALIGTIATIIKWAKKNKRWK